jgi:hypothetical protein
MREERPIIMIKATAGSILFSARALRGYTFERASQRPTSSPMAHSSTGFPVCRMRSLRIAAFNSSVSWLKFCCREKLTVGMSCGLPANHT